MEDVPDDTNNPGDSKFKGSVLPVLSKKLLINSLSILYDYLLKNPERSLVSEVTNYLNTAVYKMFRAVYSGNPKNQDKLFSIPEQLYSGFADASMARSEANIKDMLSSQPAAHTPVDTEPFQTSGEQISEDYPQLASSLFNLIQQAEKQAK